MDDGSFQDELGVVHAFSTPLTLNESLQTGDEPVLGGELRQKAVWVEETDCIGCRYCAHVASNTFLMIAETGRCRAIRQDGDSIERIQEAIDTCPVDCIHWVDFEHLIDLRQRQLETARSRGIPQA
ncbi:MAG: ferredoxin [Synechococcus sp. SAT82]|nr:ferredoxin [Synechococcus sp. SAT82]